MMWAFPWLVSTVLMVWLFVRLDRTRQALSMEKSRNHAFCVSAIFSVVGDAHAASVLRRAADKWDSVEEQHRLKMVAQDYMPGGPSVPAMWLRAEADRLDPRPKAAEPQEGIHA